MQLKKLSNNFWGFLILGVVLWLGFSFLTYKQYGITADEEIEYKSGKALVQYYLTLKDPINAGISERQLPTKSPYFRLYPAILGLLNPTGYYEHFHLLNMLFALVLFVIFYMWLFYEYKSSLIAFAGASLIFLVPRFLGDIPTNTKDYPFAVMYFLSLGLIYFADKLKFKGKCAILGVVFGITQSLRSLGFTLYVGFKKPSKQLFITIAISFLTMFLLFPYFRVNFPESIFSLATNASKFANWSNTILFMGDYLTKEQRPQIYLPVWIAIATPLFVLIPFLLSFFVKTKTTTKRKDLYTLMHLMFVTNLLLYFLVKPVIYNGLRHFLFLLPIMTFTAYIFIVDILTTLKNKKLKLSVVLVLAINITLVVFSMIKLHPYEYLYFNELVGGIKGAQNKFELDYWGSTYKEASEWLRDNATPKSKVYACNMSYAVQYYSQGKYEVVSNGKDADYIMCDIDNDNLNKYKYPVVYEVTRNSTTLNRVRKVN